MVHMAPSVVFDQVVKATDDRLRPLGFIRRGLVLRIVGLDTCGIVQFQRSTKNTQDRLLFTVNLGVVCCELLESGSSGLRTARIIDAHVRERIGMLLPDRFDKWWEINDSTDPDALGREVSDLIVEKGLPFIQRCLSTSAIMSLWESGQSPGLTDGQRAKLLAILKAKRQGGAA